ncbi:nitrite reductase small subunit NirD [Kocuria soli]|uniref:Nitrite reductase small subunit NirD n=1 Tax=Kocuria soli TaxID=2485125 RepID=A0A3N3ZQ86_9MICC|nr:nitrite reductase small subunit NirD [Kocuria soli]ROZ63301.1 nitrite reductase small subunit NirD [Kocuria soli]
MYDATTISPVPGGVGLDLPQIPPDPCEEGPNLRDPRPVKGRAVDICALRDLEPTVAVAARVDGVQVALVRMPDDTVYAVDHRDPRTGTCTMARGIVGSKGDEPTIAAPLYKEVYSLLSGRCLSDTGHSLVTHPVEVRDGRVMVLARQWGTAEHRPSSITA